MFWKNFEAERKKLLIRHKEIINSCGLSDCYISAAKTRKNAPPADKAYKIAQILNVTIEELVTGEAGLEYFLQTA